MQLPTIESLGQILAAIIGAAIGITLINILTKRKLTQNDLILGICISIGATLNIIARESFPALKHTVTSYILACIFGMIAMIPYIYWLKRRQPPTRPPE